MAKAKHVVHLAYHVDETSRAAGVSWHVPMTHFLESWGDTRAADGTVAVAQPLVAPLLDPADGGRSAIELVAALSGDAVRDGRELVRRRHMQLSGRSGNEFEAHFRTCLDRGACEGTVAAAQRTPAPSGAERAMSDWVASRTEAEGMDLAFFSDGKVFDGRFANVGWLQELPDPVTKITWDNALLMSAATAAKLGAKTGDMVSVSVPGGAAAVDAAAWEPPVHYGTNPSSSSLISTAPSRTPSRSASKSSTTSRTNSATKSSPPHSWNPHAIFPPASS